MRAKPSIYTPWTADGDTPAPWSIEDGDERVVVRDACGGLIADLTNGFHDDDGDWVMSAACGPLANIVGKAPDMLAALKDLHDKTAELIAHLQATDRLRPCFNLPALAKAQEVIAQVEGAS